jgi:hypothetical protein
MPPISRRRGQPRCVKLAGPRHASGRERLLHVRAIGTRRRPRRAALPVVHHAQLRVELTISPVGDGVYVPHRRQDLCCRRPLRSGALLPLPAVSSDELDRNRAVAGETSPTPRLLPLLDEATFQESANAILLTSY